MSIADKLTTIAENQQKVYNSGFAAGKAQGGGGAYDEGFAAGQQAEYDRFWDAYQYKGNRADYEYAFGYSYWTDEIYNPKYPIIPSNATGIRNAFVRNGYITDTKVPITVFGAGTSAFYNCRSLKRIPKLIFNGATDLSSMFNNCNDLEELYCEGEIASSLSLSQSTKLTKVSLTSIVEALSVTATGKTLTLSKTAVDREFGYYEDGELLLPGSEDEPWSILVATKPNWTISLV